MRNALYRKNIRQWEQWSRALSGVAMVLAALAVPSAAARALLVAGGAFMIVTGFVGWCPACAMFGRPAREGAGHATR